MQHLGYRARAVHRAPPGPPCCWRRCQVHQQLPLWHCQERLLQHHQLWLDHIPAVTAARPTAASVVSASPCGAACAFCRRAAAAAAVHQHQTCQAKAPAGRCSCQRQQPGRKTLLGIPGLGIQEEVLHSISSEWGMRKATQESQLHMITHYSKDRKSVHLFPTVPACVLTTRSVAGSPGSTSASGSVAATSLAEPW